MRVILGLKPIVDAIGPSDVIKFGETLMVLEYVALFILIVGVIVAIYVFLFIHDIPYAIAKKRNHPHTETIHVACWLSMFTLHAIWPLVYMWAVSKAPPLPIKLVEGNELEKGDSDAAADLRATVEALKQQVEMLEQRIEGKPS
jgi:hypothetical protein